MLGFPTMVGLPNKPMGFSNKNDQHLGWRLGVPPFKETPMWGNYKNNAPTESQVVFGRFFTTLKCNVALFFAVWSWHSFFAGSIHQIPWPTIKSTEEFRFINPMTQRFTFPRRSRQCFFWPNPCKLWNCSSLELPDRSHASEVVEINFIFKLVHWKSWRQEFFCVVFVFLFVGWYASLTNGWHALVAVLKIVYVLYLESPCTIWNKMPSSMNEYSINHNIHGTSPSRISLSGKPTLTIFWGKIIWWGENSPNSNKLPSLHTE